MELKEYQKRIHTQFLVTDGRFSNVLHSVMGLGVKLLTSVFHLAPMYETKSGKLKLRGFMTGYIQNTSDQFVRYVLKNTRNMIGMDLITAY